MKGILKGALAFVICAVVFIGGSYAYLTNHIENKTKTGSVSKEKQDEPYTAPEPQNCGILVAMPDKSGMIFYLDFLKKGITAIPIEDTEEIEKEYMGYSVDYNIYADYSLLSGLIDRIGGVEFEEDGVKERLTGMGVVEKLGSNSDRLLKYKILKSAFDTISQNGLTRSDLIYITENCDSTQLSVADCFYWVNYLKEMAGNINIIT